MVNAQSISSDLLPICMITILSPLLIEDFTYSISDCHHVSTLWDWSKNSFKNNVSVSSDLYFYLVAMYLPLRHPTNYFDFLFRENLNFTSHCFSHICNASYKLLVSTLFVTISIPQRRLYVHLFHRNVPLFKIFVNIINSLFCLATTRKTHLKLSILCAFYSKRPQT